MRPDPIGGVKEQVGSVRDVLLRHGHEVKGNKTRCPSPDHEDRHPSASLYVSPSDGDERVRCHACGFDEDAIGLARLFGETVSFPKIGDRVPVKVEPRRLSSAERDFAMLAVKRATFPLEWEAAKILAPLRPVEIERELGSNLAYLSDRGDVDLIKELAFMIRGVAFRRFALADEMTDRYSHYLNQYVPSNGMSRAVDRLLVALNRELVAK